MARGAIVKNGVVVEVLEVASDLDTNYGGPGVAFVPDDIAQVGDAWNSETKTFTYLQPSKVGAEEACREIIHTAALSLGYSDEAISLFLGQVR